MAMACFISRQHHGQREGGAAVHEFRDSATVRLQGVASVRENDPLMTQFVEAQMIVRVAVTEVWPNCPRYVHRYQKVKASRYVPRAQCETPLAGWKRIDRSRPTCRQRIREEAEGRRPAQYGGLVRQSCARQSGGLRCLQLRRKAICYRGHRDHIFPSDFLRALYILCG
jgi:hypothetical protein